MFLPIPTWGSLPSPQLTYHTHELPPVLEPPRRRPSRRRSGVAWRRVVAYQGADGAACKPPKTVFDLLFRAEGQISIAIAILRSYLGLVLVPLGLLVPLVLVLHCFVLHSPFHGCCFTDRI